MIESITNEEEGLVTLLPGFKNKFEDGDQIVFREVLGMNLQEGEGSINGTVHSVKVVNTSSFKIGNTLGFTKYEGNGIAKQIRVPLKKSFKTLEECYIHEKQEGQEPLFD